MRFDLVFYLDFCIGDFDELAKSLSTKTFVFRRFEGLPPPCCRTSTLDYDSTHHPLSISGSRVKKFDLGDEFENGWSGSLQKYMVV